MNLTPEQLTAIANQPGYAIEGDYEPGIPEAYKAAGAYHERDLQADVIAWCDSQGYPYNLIYCNANGQYRKGQAMEPGLRPGIPDLFLPFPVPGSHGLYIELKVGKNRRSAAQIEWGNRLFMQDYAVHECRTLDEVQGVIGEYLAGGWFAF